MKKSIWQKKYLLSFFILSSSSVFSKEIHPMPSLNLKEVFSASPIIYSILLFLSISSVCIWLYSLISFRRNEMAPKKMIDELHTYLSSNYYDEALSFCNKKKNILSCMISSGINNRKHGHQLMLDTMKAEGKRASYSYWQRINLLNDIVLVAPMLGLLGTVLGMFYAFYDINRSVDTVASLFDGLGIAVGTTVAGLVVAIIAMLFSTTLKYRLIKTLNVVEKEAITLSNYIEKQN